MAWDLNSLLNPYHYALLLVMLVISVYNFVKPPAKSQEGRWRNQRHRGKKGNARAFVILEPLKPLKTTPCSVPPKMDPVYEVANQFNNAIEDLTRWLDMLNWQMSVASDNSWNSITATENESSSRGFLTLSREDSQCHHGMASQLL